METPFGFSTPESPKDYRDINYSELTRAVPLPASYFVDYSKIPVTMQYKRGSCVAHATAKRKEAVELDDRGVLVALSPRFLYSIIKKEDGNTTEGTAIRNGLKMLSKVGICLESTYPSDYPTMSHDEFMDYSKIPDRAFQEAVNYKDQSYASVPLEKEAIKQAIMVGQGVIARIIIDDQWWTPSWQEKDILPLRPHKTTSYGGHAVVLYGWEGDRFWGRNSWSTDWGHNGDFYFDWETYKSSLSEVWVSVDVDSNKLEEVHNLPEHKPLTRNLSFGMMGEDVKRIQKVLKVSPETGYFGPKTLQAVINFQKQYGITPTLGFVGEKTRLKLNTLYFN